MALVLLGTDVYECVRSGMEGRDCPRVSPHVVCDLRTPGVFPPTRSMELCNVIRTSILALTVLSLGVACSSSPPPQPQPAPIVATAPPPTVPEAPPVAPPAVVHPEAHLDRGHITLEHQILFDTDSDRIREQDSQTVLNDLIALLRENSNIRRIRVEGHTDLRGDARRNQNLSQRRAQAVADYLRSHGFPSIEFEAVGYGQTQPLCRENTDACHDRNRRVEFTILDPPPPAN